MSKSFIYENTRPVKSSGSSKFYTLKGYEDFIDKENNPQQNEENHQTQAKEIPKLDGSYRYFIKVTGDGKPHNLLSEHLNVRNPVLLKTIGKNQAEYKEVNQKIFSMYLNFLKSKNISWLYNSEREMM